MHTKVVVVRFFLKLLISTLGIECALVFPAMHVNAAEEYSTTAYKDKSVLLARPAIRQHLSLTDGDYSQLTLSLERSPVKTTKKKRHINDFLFNPPDVSTDLLSVKDVVEYTLMNNPEIGIARWQMEDSHLSIRAAQAAFLPTVDLNAATGLEATGAEAAVGTGGLNRNEASLRISQRLYDFGRSRNDIRRAQSIYQSRALLHRHTVEKIIFNTVNAYLDLIASTQLLSSAKENVAAHERIFNLVAISNQGGNTSEAELKRASTRLDRSRALAIDFEKRREETIGKFRKITGLEPGNLREPTLDVSMAYQLTENSIDALLSDHPVLQSILRDINSIEHQITTARRAHLPDISLNVASKYQDNVQGNKLWSSEGRAMVGATWNLYNGGASGVKVRQLRVRHQENKQRLIKERNQLKQDAFNIISVLRTSHGKTEIYKNQLESSERVIELYFKQFQGGQRTLLELLDAQADLSRAREEVISNKFELLSAAFASLRFQSVLVPTLSSQLHITVDRQQQP